MSGDLSLYYAIGTSIATLNTFWELGITEPFQEAMAPYGVQVDAQDGLVYGHGWESSKLHWGFISQTERDLLKTYCPGASATVYMYIHDEDWDWAYCKVNLIWQPENPPSNGQIVDFSIGLRIIENYGASPP